ncbi:MAG: beta-hydroxyacyl-ACP dehydratase [Prevotella sp.]|nr:beta-hydroxyacyl-ACP dehydratase [Candidatus Prevotella equi]
MLYKDEEIFQLIPQRAPIVMVDKFIDAEGDVCHSGLSVKADNYFIEEDGMMAETGLIEHIAQSASAFAGYRYFLKGLPAPVGYIGEVKNYHCYKRPSVGDELFTEVVFGAEVDGITLMSGKTSCGGEVIAETKMKIFVE